jgi:hypothetical protein
MCCESVLDATPHSLLLLLLLLLLGLNTVLKLLSTSSANDITRSGLLLPASNRICSSCSFRCAVIALALALLLLLLLLLLPRDALAVTGDASSSC